MVNLLDTITSDIVSLSSVLSTLIKSLILLSISFLSSSFLLDFSPTFETSTLPLVNKFKDLEFKSITKGKVDVSKVGEKSNKKDENKKEIDSKINDLINILKTELKETISDVIVSERLTKSPILLVAEEAGMDINMEKLMKMHNQKTPVSKKILEINPNHPMIVNLSQNLTKIDHKKASNLILDQANILDGNILSNPSAYLENLTEIFIK